MPRTQRLYLVVTEPLDITTLEFFPRHDFDVRRFKHDLPRACYVTREFSAYQERFRGQLGIASERALRLLHKTQSAKNRAISTLSRDLMGRAGDLLRWPIDWWPKFGELHAAHQAVWRPA